MQLAGLLRDAELRGADQLAVGHGDGVQHAIQLVAPEIQEPVEVRELRIEIILLPEIGLEQGGVVGQSVEDFGRGEAVSGELAFEVGAHGHLSPSLQS